VVLRLLDTAEEKIKKNEVRSFRKNEAPHLDISYLDALCGSKVASSYRVNPSGPVATAAIAAATHAAIAAATHAAAAIATAAVASSRAALVVSALLP